MEWAERWTSEAKMRIGELEMIEDSKQEVCQVFREFFGSKFY